MGQDLLAAIKARRSDPAFGHSWGYHSRVSLKNRYVCMTVPKAACTTIKRTLHEFEGLPPIADHGELHEDNQHPRLSHLDAAEAATALRSDDWLRFAFVRNPYDRMFSAWKSKIANPRDTQYHGLREDIRAAFGYPDAAGAIAPAVAFGDFVRFVIESTDPALMHDGHWNRQTEVMLWDLISYDVVGRFETFADDFAGVLRSLGAPEAVLALAAEVTNATTRLPLAAAYDRHLANLIYLHYQPDFEAFGYDRTSWYFA